MSETEITLTPMQFRNAIVHIGACCGPREFAKIWGDGLGGHMWKKFHLDFDKDLTRFIGYLDLGNLRMLVKYLETKKGDAI